MHCNRAPLACRRQYWSLIELVVFRFARKKIILAKKIIFLPLGECCLLILYFTSDSLSSTHASLFGQLVLGFGTSKKHSSIFYNLVVEFQEPSLLSWIFEKFVLAMIIFFVLSIFNSLAQSYHKRIQKKRRKSSSKEH